MRHGPAVPPHVSIVLDGAVQLAGLTGELRAALACEGVQVTHHFWSDPVIRFAEQQGGIPQNPELVRILSTLARLGFAFLRDHRQGWSPEDILLDLRDRGLFHGAVRACGFDGQAWQVQEVPE